MATDQGPWPTPGGSRPTMPRGRPTFLTRTATDDADRLQRRSSIPAPWQGKQPPEPAKADSTVKPTRVSSQPPAEQSSPPQANRLSRRLLGNFLDGTTDAPTTHRQPSQRRKRSDDETQPLLEPRVTANGPGDTPNGKELKVLPAKSGAPPRPVGGTDKLNTLSGVFVPTSLNVLSILMFIRFGFILGQGGLIGMLGMLVAAYVIDLVTTMSISAVASNGTVRGGGAYYLISRSLGPEFGGAIGMVSYMGFVFNTGMNAVGLVDCLIYNFGTKSGNWANTMPEGDWWQYLWSTIVVMLCVLICLAGSALFARVSNGLLLVLLIAIISIPISALVREPFINTKQYVNFTGFSAQTFRENLLPLFTRGAAGGKKHGKETYQDLFGVLFPATCGILAGASMSGDLKNPSKSIPKGTLSGLGLTFISYTLVILALAASITRESFYENVNVVQDTNLSGVLILAGEIASTFFSTLMGIIGPAKQLQAIARDNVFPGLTVFGQGNAKSDAPLIAILFTFVVTQFVLLLDINRIASLITMAYLMTFFALNVATFLLKIGSAPNFRPSFQYFNWGTAAFGAVLSVVTMFFVDGFSASGAVMILLLLITIIHYTTPPKPWGSISEVLIYHQVRKYLLRLRTEHVKFWRPQILLFVNDPRRGYKLIQFCNSLKKGGLYILGHVIVTQNFGASVPEARKQQEAWTKYIDFSRIKAFVNVAISPSIEWGSRNIVLSAGLGGMRPNIVVFGIYNLQQFRSEQPLVDVPSPPPERKAPTNLSSRRRSRSQLKGELPTDAIFLEKRTDVQSYVMVLEDMILKLQTNVAIAASFGDLELPNAAEGNTKKYIDLWPIQMSAAIVAEQHGLPQNIQTSNFDTYTLILQLGCILNTVPSWKRSYSLRVAVFVEYESDVEEERLRVTSLLENLRIQAEVMVFWLACGTVKSYELIVNDAKVDEETESHIDKVLEDEAWWAELGKVRGKVRSGDISAVDAFSLAEEVNWPSPGMRTREHSVIRFDGLRKLLRSHKRSSFSNLSNAGLSLSMRTSRIDDDMLSRHASHPSDSEYSKSEDDDDEDAETEEDDDHAGFDMSDMDDISSPSKSKSKASSSKKSSRASSRKSRSSKHKRDNSGSHVNSPLAVRENRPLINFDEEVLSRPASRRGRSGDHSRHHSDASSTSTSPKGVSRAQSPAIGTPEEAEEVQDPAGPSIAFADDPHPRHKKPSEEEPKQSIYRRSTDGPSASHSKSPPRNASGYPATASLPLSFNNLPSRAQHLILNDLMSQNSDETAVIFTTLPAPVEGTYKSEADSLGYVSDLEVLYGGLPPMLLVHSNSMTVTMNL
jgi:solute carrier family 12 (potassium/chloride transporters), member 9